MAILLIWTTMKHCFSQAYQEEAGEEAEEQNAAGVEEKRQVEEECLGNLVDNLDVEVLRRLAAELLRKQPAVFADLVNGELPDEPQPGVDLFTVYFNIRHFSIDCTEWECVGYCHEIS
ncbi:Hypothetical predicted protein [Paramuricea clavata]|uniref:Uncharacterized protein n=1 Tax=Paramuricea clavata TaxID=317549 RepID=A0A6S7GEH4_PARCT|nr:Hypothetical predicted protein [Paramuricea clavata]